MADVISVSALNKYVKSILESNPVLTDLSIRGEVSNFNRNYKTGHCYFSLKDDKAGIRAVMFASDASRLAFEPENGMQVIARGRITLYERDGTYQIIVDLMALDGIGAAQQAFLQLKERLEKKGWFAPEYKKALPPWPGKIGLVTSKTGAALQDILSVSQKRCPFIHYLLAPVSVQGQASVPGIVQAIQQLDSREDVDLIIIARGGGSAEDLWVFNAEAIAEAVFACKTPVVSAIGHEIDFTILDFVADLRAPTPSAAAEMVLPDIKSTTRHMMSVYENITNKIQFRVESCYNSLHKQFAFLQQKSPAKRQEQLRADLRLYTDRMLQCKAQKVQQAEDRYKNCVALAGSLNPYAVMSRGYSLAKSGGHVLTSVEQVQPGQSLDVILQDGRAACQVISIEKEQVNL